jgi:RimJ/RimL family protein N-acetyltransferase
MGIRWTGTKEQPGGHVQLWCLDTVPLIHACKIVHDSVPPKAFISVYGRLESYAPSGKISRQSEVSTMTETKLLQGKKLRLTAVTQADLPIMARWWEDAEFLRLYDSVPAYPKTEEELLQRIQSGRQGNTVFLFGIRPKTDNRLVGLFELDGIMWTHGTTHVSIAIGDSADRGQGYGYEAMQLGLRFAFHELNLHRVFLSVFSYNQRALDFYDQLGFAREGILREHLARDGRRHDMIFYGMLRREWEEKRANVSNS